MPTSTVWRGRSDGSPPRIKSPIRPTTDSIEPLSPTPSRLESSPTLNYYPLYSARQQSKIHQPRGLGLSRTTLTNDPLEITRSDQLHFEQAGDAHVGVRARSVNRHGRNTKGGRPAEARQNNRMSKASKVRNHTRSGSTIDDLANAAIATSPTFASSSPSYAFGGPANLSSARPATSYINGYAHNENFFDRPSKRVKSEKLHATEWAHKEERPRTSHAHDYQSPRTEDAELLLNLTYGVSWTTASPALPPAVPIQEQLRETFDVDANIDIAPPTKIVQEEIEKDTDQETAYAENSIQDLEKKSFELQAEQEIVPPTDNGDDTQSLASVDKAAQPNESPITAKVEACADKPAECTPANLLQQGELEMPAEIEMTAAAAIPKKIRKIQPEVQAEVCASCQRLQRDWSEEDGTTHWIGCEHCKQWYHAACAGFKDKQEARSVDKFFCKECEPQYGNTTFVRKSSRARTAIDYAGLNQGVVKASDDSSMHHYIQPIKDGRLKVLPDDFARVRPELLTAEFWESMDGMKRPLVVPACWNPRFGEAHTDNGHSSDTMNDEPLHEATFKYYDNQGNETDEPVKTASTSKDGSICEAIEEQVIDCDQDYLDMVMPRDLTVRKVAELYGPMEPVPVIDVKSQETKGAFTLSDWAEYYELDGNKPIRNVISLEVSNSRLGRLIRRPKVVRDIDLEDQVWDHDTRSTSKKRPVQFYCLMSVADSYTDFHIDFGGSSVYYHILKGVKTFFFIPPEDKYLKRYEEWCNSDTQNETWLPDLCNGNVTRVDLHEGDTAFIPAGWIHSVWTPEDSLVIGGNFLTRLDYELQLKVFGIEKATNVPLKFRYPFFQKVMWFALIKYLEEDPVPEEVLRDFQEDPDYRFLRANPIWYENNDSDNVPEPGDHDYNARLYPKSELKGLPALRDYLYRTARVNADLPVPDINKRQIDSIKASVPKTFGDPMQLVKTFAVWCVWKLGNEPAPEWVHTDAGLILEAKESDKVKKPEVFRVPPERVSARKALQVQVTPTVESVANTPSKLVQDSEGDDSAKKQRSGSKGSGLRVACEPCRKRRIKCRHKDGDASPTSASPAAIRPRTYSNVSVDIPKLASASPVLNGYDHPSTTNGSSDFGNTSDLAQAALATLHSQSSDPGQSMSASVSAASKKGRSKACEECRKSKRRCVHDEYGRVDPAKAAEPSKPRGSAMKRTARTSDEYPVKRMKVEADIDPALTDPALLGICQPMNMESMIDPALMADMYTDGPHELDQSYMHATAFDLADESALADFTMSSMNEEHYQNDVKGGPETCDGVEDSPFGNSTSAGLGILTQPPAMVTAQVIHLRQSPDHDIGYSPITVDSHPIESTEKVDVIMEDIRDSTPQLDNASGLVQEADGVVQGQHTSSSRTLPQAVKSERRASSSIDSLHTIEIATETRRSSSNTSGAVHQAVSAHKHKLPRDVSARPISRRGSTASSDMDADERMARELQASENGLRRRTSVRA